MIRRLAGALACAVVVLTSTVRPRAATPLRMVEPMLPPPPPPAPAHRPRAHLARRRAHVYREHLVAVHRAHRARLRRFVAAAAYSPNAIDRMILEVFGPALYPTAERIAGCESGDDPNARNPYSTATGVFQILNGPTDPMANIRLAYSMERSRGWEPWAASEACWG